MQKYVHPLDRWNALSAEQQEAVIGRRRFDGLELDDAESGQKAHKALATIVDDDGVEHDIFRDNMPLGSPATQFGTYFIGHSRRLWVIEKMLDQVHRRPAGTP